MSRKIEGQSPPMEMQASARKGEDDTAERKLQAFFETNRKFFQLYAGDASIQAEPSRKLGTFAIDLQKGTLYGDPSYYEKKGLTEAHAFDSFLHEFEHFRRLMTVVREPGGLEVWKAHRERMSVKPRLQIFDNVLEDISVDRAKVARAPSSREAQEELYRTHLWPDRDFTKLPKHLQFIYASFRETMLPDEPVTVSPDVRAELKKMNGIKNKAGQSLMDVMSHPELPQAKRWAMQQRFFEPIYEKLFEEDVKEKEKQKQKEEQKGEKGNESKGEAEAQGKTAEGPMRPDDHFKEEYGAYHEKSPDAAISEEEWDKAVEAMQKPSAPGKTSEQRTAEAYAKEAGVSLEDLKHYQTFWESVETLENPETDEPVVEELRAAFRKILTERLHPVAKQKHPVKEGQYLVRPAEAVAEIKSGRMEPAVWETREPREKSRELSGAFDVTVVCDRSQSMQSDNKDVEQRKATAMVLEAMREFCDDLEEQRRNLQDGLQVRSEAWGFGGPEDLTCLKPLSEELTDRQRVAVYKELGETPGNSTRDDLALKAIRESIPEEDWKKIEQGQLRKIVLVLTDGESSNKDGVRAELEQLRGRGVYVVVVGITNAAHAALDLYKPDARLTKTAAEIGTVVADILETQIKGLNDS